MADVYVCFVCKARANSISDLHLHQTSCHSINQLSLALLTSHGVVKTDDIVLNEDSNNNMNKTNSGDNHLQAALSQCVTAMDKILPAKTTKEGRRKKNPKPRRNYKRATKKKSSNTQDVTAVLTRNQKLSKEPSTEINEIKPIQQPHLSSTINTPLPPKRTLRKKALVNYYDLSINPRIEFSNDHNKNCLQSKSSENNSVQKVRVRRYGNRTKKSSDKDSPLLKSMLVGKSISRNTNQINIIDAANYKYLQPKYKIDHEPSVKIKENITWNRIYQNYVQGYESYRESMKIQENYVLVPNKINYGLSTHTSIENKYILSQNQQNLSQNQQYAFQNEPQISQNQQHLSQNQHYIPHVNYPTEGTNFYNRNSMLRSSEYAHYSQEKLDNINFQNKNFMEEGNSITDWKNTESVYIDNNYNEDANMDNLSNISLNLTSDVKDIIVEFLAQEENARARNPYWEDNMDKYFPSETESSSEIEQFNEDTEKYPDPYAMDAPLNLVVTQPMNIQGCAYNYPTVSNNYPLPSYKEFAKCKSTWSSGYIDQQSETSMVMNNNSKTCELSSAYKHKMYCTVCGEDFYNESTLAAHVLNCRDKSRDSTFENAENENILDQHIYENFCTNKSSTATMINYTNVQEVTTFNKFLCHLCKIGFVNRTKYWKHMSIHKKNLQQINQNLCAVCGLLFNSYNALQDHESQCEYKFLM